MVSRGPILALNPPPLFVVLISGIIAPSHILRYDACVMTCTPMSLFCLGLCPRHDENLISEEYNSIVVSHCHLNVDVTASELVLSRGTCRKEGWNLRGCTGNATMGHCIVQASGPGTVVRLASERKVSRRVQYHPRYQIRSKWACRRAGAIHSFTDLESWAGTLAESPKGLHIGLVSGGK